MPTPDPLWKTQDQAERLAKLTGQDPARKEAPLRRDVRSLGRPLGGRGAPTLFRSAPRA